MTKIKQSDFEGDTITTIEKPLTGRAAFIKENAAAIKAAREACCVCSPSKADLLLLAKVDSLDD